MQEPAAAPAPAETKALPFVPPVDRLCSACGGDEHIECSECAGTRRVKWGGDEPAKQATPATAEAKVLPFGAPDVSADGLQDLERAAAVLLALGYHNYCAGNLARSDSCRELAASLQKVVAFERGARLRSEPNPPDVTFGPR